MKCILLGQNARILTKAIHSFSRIGAELFIEAHQNGLSLRTVNNARSAFSIITFSPEFFTEYHSTTIADNPDDIEFENKCKVSIKSCLDVLKNMKQVEICKITINTKTSRLIIELKCKLETKKTHYISILEQETLTASYTIENAPNKLKASHKLFADIINNFQMNTEELTFELNTRKLIVKNYVEGTHVDQRYMRSQITIQPDEFDIYKVTEFISITFCLRELRSFLYFAESLNLDFTVNFDTGGRPIGFIIKNKDLYEGNLIMATLAPEDIQNECISDETRNTVRNNKKRKKRLSDDEDETIEIDDDTETIYITGKKNDVENDNSNESTNDGLIFNFNKTKPNKPSILLNNNTENEHLNNVQCISKTIISQTMPTNKTSIDINTDKIESDNISVIFQDESNEKIIIDRNKENQLNIIPPLILSNDSDDVIFNINEERLYNNNSSSTNREPINSDILRQRKTLRKIFQRCFESTQNTFNELSPSEILALNSDDDEEHND